MTRLANLGSGPFAALHQGMHRSWYERLGSRYPRADVLAVLLLLHVVALGGMAATPLYLAMSTEAFWRLLAASQASFLVVSLVAWLRARVQLRPIQAWLAGKDGADAEAAWKAAADLPFALPHSPHVLATAFLVCVGWDAYATAELDLAWPGAIGLFGGSAVIFLYWTMAAFFSLEHGMRPVLDDLGEALKDPPSPSRRIPLRLRLATAVPAINLITGVLVAGLFPGAGGIGDLAIGLAAALAVSASISLWLTNLLTDSVVTPISRLREAASRVGRGDLESRVPVTAADETADLARAFNQMIDGLRRRERLREAFGAYVDPDLAERIEEESVDLAGQEVAASIMFVDVRDFTAFSENTQPRQVVASLNELFDQLVPVILKHGGHANKFVGDGLMAVFGAPTPRDDHAECALKAACEIAAIAGRDAAEGLAVGVGVNSGQVLAGTMGGGGRLDFTVIGDAVNTAARVEAATREADEDVLATEATLDLVAAEIRGLWTRRNGIELKGKSGSVALFAPTSSAPANPK